MAKQAKKPRKTRADKRPDDEKFSHFLTVKMTPEARAKLSEQAAAAAAADPEIPKSAAGYLRWLATRDRERVNLPGYNYNEAVSPAPPAPHPQNPLASPAPIP